MPGTTLTRLVDEFLATMHRNGVVVDRQAVEQEMSERIGDIAERLRVDPLAVLRDHACDGWGQAMAAGVLEQIQNERLLGAA